MRWTVGRRIAGGFAVLLVLVVTLAALGTYSLHHSADVFEISIATQEERYALIVEQQGHLATSSLGLLRFVLTADDAFLTEWRGTLGEARQTLAALENTAPSGGLRANWAEVLRAVETWEEAGKRAAEARRAGKIDQAIRIVNDDVIPSNKTRAALVARAITAEQAHLTATVAAANALATRAFWTMIAVAAVATAVGIAAAVGLGRSITRLLRHSLSELATTSTEIVAAVAEQAAGAAEEAAAVQETSVSVEEVRQTTQVSAQKAAAVADRSQRTAQAAVDGRQAVDDSVGSMQETRARMGAIAERVLALSEQARTIGEIIATVTDVAEQSNLLSVNAAIEAAKAGEAGRGFAVVAVEVRSLAERSKQATAQVRTILGDIQRATQAAVMAAEQGVKSSDAGEVVARKAGEVIRVLTDTVSDSAQSAHQIVAATQQQVAGMDQIGLAMQNIQQATSQNVAATRQVEQAARNLQTLAGRISVLVDTRSNGHRQRPAAG